MRAILASLVAVLALGTGVALAAGPVHQGGTSSQGRPVGLSANSDFVTRFDITWRAKCGRSTYVGSTEFRQVSLRPDGTFRQGAKYSHKVSGGRRAHVDVLLTGGLNPQGTRAAGAFRGAARVDGVGTCRSGKITWRTHKSAD